MNNKKRVLNACMGTLMVGAMVAAPLVGYASEPNNDFYPWMTTGAVKGIHHDMSVHASTTTGTFGSGGEAITPTGDVDYHIMTCGGNRKVTAVSVSSLDADVDIKAYKPDGTLLGTSQGTGSSESINVSAFNEDIIVMKVYGYNGAVENGFFVQVSC